MDGREKLIDGIAKACKVEPSELADDLRFNEDLGATSGTYFAIIAVMEELTDQKVKYAQLRKRKTVGEVLAFYDELVG